MLLSFAVINAAFEIELLPLGRSNGGGGEEVEGKGKGGLLGVDTSKYGLGTLQPGGRAGFRIRRRERRGG